MLRCDNCDFDLVNGWLSTKMERNHERGWVVLLGTRATLVDVHKDSDLCPLLCGMILGELINRGI